MPVYRGGGYRNDPWEETGNALGQLIMSLIFKDKLNAQRQYPAFAKSVEESELTGEGGPPAEMLQKTPGLGKLYTKRTGKPAPAYEQGPERPPVTKQTPEGFAMNVPQSNISVPTPAWPKSGPDMSVRATNEQRAGRTLPQPFEEEVLTNRASAISIIQQRNPKLAAELALRYGLDLPSIPEDTNADTQLNSRVNTALKIKEDYLDVEWEELEPYVYYAQKLPSLEGRKRRPKEYAGDEDPQMTTEAWLKLYQKPILDKYKDDPALGQKKLHEYLQKFKASKYRWTPESEGITANFEKPMTVATAAITARDMFKYLGGEVTDWINRIQADTVKPEEWSEYYILKGRAEDERVMFEAARAMMGRSRGRAMELINKIYELRGFPLPKGLLDKLFSRLFQKEQAGELSLLQDSSDGLRAVELELNLDDKYRGMRKPATVTKPKGTPADKKPPENPNPEDPYYYEWIK